MKKRNRSTVAKAGAEQILHRAARIEDAFHEFRKKRARRRGYIETIVPYTGYGSTEWIRVLARVVLIKPPRPGSKRVRPQQKREERVRGWRSFMSIPLSDLVVTIQIGDKYEVVQADRGGVIDTIVPVLLSPGWQTIFLSVGDNSLSDTDSGPFNAETPTGLVAAIKSGDPVPARVTIVDPTTTVGVVSDVDDTVMVTALPRPLLAAWNTFVLDEHARIPTPGMAVLLERLSAANSGAPVVYLSTGAWNVAPTLGRFLSRNLYPAGPLLLTDWGPTHDRWFRSGREHKRANLRRLAEEFPAIRWILVGDDGQHDEEIYAEFAEDHPSGVAAIAIRQLSPGEAVLAGGRSKDQIKTEHTGVLWAYAADGAGLADQLAAEGLL